ncbi:hypothetical protein ELY21_07255 [Legionella sp. km535]|uniref:hypothetical protein n=1 Tax=Legionella sp. km535 TaxID=2498107 RepID=UPI000F8E1C75|nr:hypothetical protein [Legionella sp. km535]RUR18493.1 hypothetical protein ELY21_07255 [Legionella sp. km535]
MPQFDLNKLVVLHLYQYSKPRGEQDPLYRVEKTCDAVKLSTCTRIIYILTSDSLVSEEQSAAYKSLTDFLGRQDMYSGGIKFERLDGDKAYEFLLYWMIGGINPKKTLNDPRILGDVRALWTKMTASPSARAQKLVEIFSAFFKDLFTDSASLHKLLSVNKHLDQATLVETFKNACQNCTWARVNGFLSCLSGFTYQHFLDNTYLEHFEINLRLVKDKILNKVELSPTGAVISFFQPKYEPSEERLKGIEHRLKTVNELIAYLNALKASSVEVKLSAQALIKDSQTPKVDDELVLLDVESSTKDENDDSTINHSSNNTSCQL